MSSCIVLVPPTSLCLIRSYFKYILFQGGATHYEILCIMTLCIIRISTVLRCTCTKASWLIRNESSSKMIKCRHQELNRYNDDVDRIKDEQMVRTLNSRLFHQPPKRACLDKEHTHLKIVGPKAQINSSFHLSTPLRSHRYLRPQSFQTPLL